MKRPFQIGFGFEQPLDSAEALENALRVVHAIDADREEFDVEAQVVDDRRTLAFRAGRGVRRRLVGHGHADGIRTDERHVAPAVDGESVPFGQRFDGAIDGSQEVVAVRLRVEADEIGANQAVHQLALPRADAEDLGVRPRNVPEDRHARVRPRLLHEPRQQREVVVVHQQDRRTHVPHFFEHRVAKWRLTA